MFSRTQHDTTQKKPHKESRRSDTLFFLCISHDYGFTSHEGDKQFIQLWLHVSDVVTHSLRAHLRVRDVRFSHAGFCHIFSHHDCQHVLVHLVNLFIDFARSQELVVFSRRTCVQLFIVLIGLEQGRSTCMCAFTALKCLKHVFFHRGLRHGDVTEY